VDWSTECHDQWEGSTSPAESQSFEGVQPEIDPSPIIVFCMTTLIVATDGSDLAIQAALAGLKLTKPGDNLVIVSVIDLVDPMEGAGGHAGPTLTHEQVEASHRDARAEGEAAVTATAKAIQQIGYSSELIETMLVEGDPGPTLCRVASDRSAAALILGSRGRGGLRRALMGSVSDYVVRNAPCSVVVSRDG
jgi:nucleotide-binding universal stress UspA family protein